MKNQKYCMPVGDYFILAIELKSVENKVLNKYGRNVQNISAGAKADGV